MTFEKNLILDNIKNHDSNLEKVAENYLKSDLDLEDLCYFLLDWVKDTTLKDKEQAGMILSLAQNVFYKLPDPSSGCVVASYDYLNNTIQELFKNHKKKDG